MSTFDLISTDPAENRRFWTNRAALALACYRSALSAGDGYSRGQAPGCRARFRDAMKARRERRYFRVTADDARKSRAKRPRFVNHREEEITPEREAAIYNQCAKTGAKVWEGIE